jgi:adenosine deaminase
LTESSADRRQTLQRLPKVDLHRHLEGSLRVETLAELVRNEHLDLPTDEARLRALAQISPWDPRASQTFLSKFEFLRQFYRSPEIVERTVRETVADAAADGVRYLELRFTPAALAQARQYPLGEVFDWVIEASAAEARDRGIGVGLIASVNRQEPIRTAEQVAQLAADRRGAIAGLDLAGNEADFPADPFRQVFGAAKQDGLGITIHAGEWSGPAAVRQAIEALGADRIGHGVRTLEDPSLVALAKERRIVFEVCLTSNLHSGAVLNPSEHPLPRMLEAGLQVVIGTDDPGISGTTLSDEFLLAIELLDLSMESLKGLTLAAAQAAFLLRREKAMLEKELRQAFFGGG